METVAPCVVNVELAFNEVFGRSQLAEQVARYVLIVHEAGDVERGAATFVLFHDPLEDVVLVQCLAGVGEAVHDLGQVSGVDHGEDAVRGREEVRVEADSDIDPLLLSLLLHFLTQLKITN